MRLLETEGLNARLVLIDGSPDLMKAIKNEQLAASNEEELQTNVLVGIMDMVTPALSGELYLSLQKCNTWNEKLDIFMQRIPSESLMISEEQQRNICSSVYNRLLAVENYDISSFSPLRSVIMLLKPSLRTLKTISEDYGLGKVINKIIKFKKVYLFTLSLFI